MLKVPDSVRRRIVILPNDALRSAISTMIPALNAAARAISMPNITKRRRSSLVDSDSRGPAVAMTLPRPREASIFPVMQRQIRLLTPNARRGHNERGSKLVRLGAHETPGAARRLLRQTLRLHGGHDRGSGCELAVIALQVRPFREINADMTRPAKNHEEVRVRYCESIAR